MISDQSLVSLAEKSPQVETQQVHAARDTGVSSTVQTPTMMTECTFSCYCLHRILRPGGATFYVK